MKDYRRLRTKAVQLRRRGLSYNEIRQHIPVAKSTLSLWLKGVRLKPEHQKRLYTKRIAILALGPQSQKERRRREVEAILRKAQQEIKLPPSSQTYRLFGAALYWAEGSKGKMFAITNSDPYFILFIVRWIDLVFTIPRTHLKARLNIYPQQNETKIKRFWSDLTGIPLKNFGKSYIKPLSQGYKKNNLYYGTIRIEIPKSTNLQYRVLGWIRALLSEMVPDIERVQMRWRSLAKTPRPVNLSAARYAPVA